MSRSPERSGLKSIVDRLISVAQGKSTEKYVAAETPPRDITVSQDKLRALYADADRKHLVPIVATLKEIATNSAYDDEANLERLIEKAGAVLTQIDARLDDVGQLVSVGAASDEDYIEVGLLSEFQSELLNWNLPELRLYVESLKEDDAPEVEVKKEKFVPRNDWERYLQQNFVEDELALPDETDPDYKHHLEHRYQTLRSRFHSILLDAQSDGITYIELKLPDIGHTTVSITGTDRRYEAHDLVKQITQGNLSVKERAVAKEFLEIFEADFNFYTIVIGTNKKFNTEGGANSIDGIKKIYDPNNATAFNTWFWRTMGSLPAFAYYDQKKGVWVEESETMGDKIFMAFKNILVRGRKDNAEILRVAEQMARDAGDLAGLDPARDAAEIKKRLAAYIPNAAEVVAEDASIRERVSFVEPVNVPPKLHTAQYFAGKRTWKPKAIAVKSVGSMSVFPWKTAFVHREEVNAAYEQITNHVSTAQDDGQELSPDWKASNNDLNARWATLLAMALAEITLEGPFQDARGGSSSPMGKPNGAREIDRLMNPTGYAYKTLGNSGSRDGEYNIAVIGAIRASFLTFLDYYGYEGKTLTQHIMESSKFSDIPWSQVLKDDATQGWFQQIVDSLGAIEKALNGFGAGDLRTIGKVDVASAEISNVNKKFISEFRTLYRKTMGYVFARDSAPGAARRKASRAEDPTAATNPTGQYMRIRIIDENGSNEPGTRETKTTYTPEGDEVVVKRTDPVEIYTRIQQYYYMSPQELFRWVDNGRGQEAYYTAGSGTEPGTITIRVKRAPGEKSGEKGNLIDPNILIARELVYKYLFMTQYEGDVIKDIRKEDILLLGMMLSKQIREKFRQRYFSGIISEAFTRIIEKFFGEESFFSPEIPNIEGPDIFTLESFESMLFYMGYEYRVEDLIHSGAHLFTALSAGTLPAAGSKK